MQVYRIAIRTHLSSKLVYRLSCTFYHSARCVQLFMALSGQKNFLYIDSDLGIFFKGEEKMNRQKFQFSSSDKNVSSEMEQYCWGPSFVVDPSFNFVSILSTHAHDLHEFLYGLM